MSAQRIHTVVIGGGQAGLAMSRSLTDRGIEHVVLERGEIGERWRNERWDSLRLLTPAWHTRLPGHTYRGPDPDAFLHKDELVALLTAYARSFDAPVLGGVTVRSVSATPDGLSVRTDGTTWLADEVVVATGHCATPSVPALTAGLPVGIEQVPTNRYRNPGQLAPGTVVVVGAGPSGQQIAAELADAGRRVVLAVGEHVRLPRRYRDRDLIWWGDVSGQFDQTTDEVRDLAAARRAPSLTLWGGGHLDLGVLHDRGVAITGRLVGADDATLTFDAGGLASTVATAEVRMHRYLDRLDRFAARAGLDGGDDPARPAPATWHRADLARLDLDREDVGAVVWATGFRPDFSFVDLPVFDPTGDPVHHRGVTPWPGLSFLGLRWQHARKSSFIDGVGDDAEHLADVIDARRRAAGVRALVA